MFIGAVVGSYTTPRLVEVVQDEFTTVPGLQGPTPELPAVYSGSVTLNGEHLGYYDALIVDPPGDQGTVRFFLRVEGQADIYARETASFERGQVSFHADLRFNDADDGQGEDRNQDCPRCVAIGQVVADLCAFVQRTFRRLRPAL